MPVGLKHRKRVFGQEASIHFVDATMRELTPNPKFSPFDNGYLRAGTPAADPPYQASSYTFACATASQSQADWLVALSQAVEDIGGAPKLAVPDNTRSRMA
jgi:hypothetical protein